MKATITGITSITFDELRNIVHIEIDERVNVHDVLQVVKQWNSGKWEHPNSQDVSAIAGDDATLQSVSVQ